MALLLPAVQAAREAARRTVDEQHEDKFAWLTKPRKHRNAFPAHAIYNEDGKPLLSWRVHILPYMENQTLYKEFPS